VRTLFFGTPEFAVASLDALRDVSEVVGVVCQPDRPAGRGLALQTPPVKARALALGIPVVQPTKLKTGEFADWVGGRRADVALVVAYGRILPGPVLASTRLGFVNVHASLLPKYRGAAPIAWAIMRGEAVTGVTLMLLDEGMDTGDTLDVVKTPIGPDETQGELAARLSAIGAESVRANLPRLERNELPRTPQRHEEATYAPMLVKKDGAIDWNETSRAIHDKVRGLHPRPGAFAQHGGKTVKVHATRRIDGRSLQAPPGTVVLADKSRVIVSCGPSGVERVEIVRVQVDGKRAVSAGEWVGGRGVKEADRLA
jgi:methionyl-tRNA formyltransferase